MLDVLPVKPKRVLSDNGSEFEGEFRRCAAARGIERFYTWPKSPKMNAHVERFNRTVQEEFLDYNEDLLWSDAEGLRECNRRLAEWLVWYNRDRVHHALAGETPLAVLVRETAPRADWFPLREIEPGPPDAPTTFPRARGASGDARMGRRLW